MADSKELYALREVFKRITENHNADEAAIKELDKKLEQVITSVASLEALILTITNSETFKKLMADELEKAAQKLGEEGDNNGAGTT